MTQYRTFRNNDPPGLAKVWNEAFRGRGAVVLPTPSALDEYLFAKPYFDPQGLIFAVEDGETVGFAHGGFGPNANESAPGPSNGVVCAIAVRPGFRGRGIGSELLKRCESYLTGRGATTIYAGPMPPFNPFYLGLYGGSDSPGFLMSDSAADPFFRHHGYSPHETCLVFQCRCEGPINVTDPRFLAIRRRYELVAQPHRGIASWWQECVLGPIDLFDVLLRDKNTHEVVASAVGWEMLGFCQRWGVPAVGLLNLSVREGLRRQGFAKFVLAHLLRYVHEQFFSLVELQTNERNEAIIGLCRRLGFEQVDQGRAYRKVQA